MNLFPFHTIGDITKVLLQDQIAGNILVWSLWVKGLTLHL